MASCIELVQQRVLHYLRVSFMVPGHTKFAPDLLFSQIVKSYYKSDLHHLVEHFSRVMTDDGGIVRMWREKVGEKYSNLPGIRDLNDFLTRAVPPTFIRFSERRLSFERFL